MKHKNSVCFLLWSRRPHHSTSPVKVLNLHGQAVHFRTEHSFKVLTVLLSILLSLCIFVFFIPFFELSELIIPKVQAKTYQIGDIITFGGYPQTQVSDPIRINTLNERANNWISYGYYSGNGKGTDDGIGSMQQGHWMEYCDIIYQGTKYRGVKFSAYRPYSTNQKPIEDYSFQDDNGYYTNHTYWFIWESLSWKVLNPSEGLVICLNIIDAQPYNNLVFSSNDKYYADKAGTTYASDYENSSLREWMINDFYNAAFSKNEQNEIKSTTLDNSSLEDKVFALSNNDLLDVSNDVDQLHRFFAVERVTDYSKCQGPAPNHQSWYLRYPLSRDGHTNRRSEGVDTTSMNLLIFPLVDSIIGVRPAFTFKTGIVEDDNPIGGDLKEEKFFSVAYNPNGGNGTPATQIKTEGQALTLSSGTPTKTYTVSYNANGGSVSPASKSVSCTFKSWNTAQNGSGTAYAPGASYTKDASVTLYAQWTNPTAGTLATPTRSGYTFDGWYTAASGGTKITSASVVTKSQTIYAHWKALPVEKDFQWGKDNWNFNNSSYSGDFSSAPYRSQISNEYLNRLKNNLTNSEYQAVFTGYYYYGEYVPAWLDDTWGGSCYGMSSTTLLAKEGYLPYSQYKKGAGKLNDLNRPTSNKDVCSLVTYYQMLQVKDVIQQQYRTVPSRSNETNIKNIISLLDHNTTVLLGFKRAGWGGHAILAYDYEYGSYSYNGVTYQGCIKICDPNQSKSYNPQCNIYFNTKTYNWAIPFYASSGISSAKGAQFIYIGANVNEINMGGYLSDSSKNTTLNDYIARIDVYSIGETRTVSKVQRSGNTYLTKTSAPGDIVEDYSYVLGNESEGTFGYNLMDGESAYMVTQADPVALKLSMDYEDCFLTASSAAGKTAVFDKKGYVAVEGESADYTLSMTFDNDYPTDWFYVQVQSSANNAKLEKTKEGYVLTADSMQNVSVKTNNREKSAAASFSTTYPSVLIYEINETTIGFKVDKDGNGTYETKIEADAGSLPGDVNGDGEVTAADARFALRAAVGLDDTDAGLDFSDPANRCYLAADVDGTPGITAADARLILRAAVGLEELK